MTRKALALLVAAALPLSPLLAFCSHSGETHVEFRGHCHAASSERHDGAPGLEAPAVSHSTAPAWNATLHGPWTVDPPIPAVAADGAEAVPQPSLRARAAFSARSPGVPATDIAVLPLLL